MEWENWRDIPVLPEEDGETILYEVYDGDRQCGTFKILSLGIAQIARTCDIWKWDINRFSIKRIADGELMWSGSIHGSGRDVTTQT